MIASTTAPRREGIEELTLGVSLARRRLAHFGILSPRRISSSFLDRVGGLPGTPGAARVQFGGSGLGQPPALRERAPGFVEPHQGGAHGRGQGHVNHFHGATVTGRKATRMRHAGRSLTHAIAGPCQPHAVAR